MDQKPETGKAKKRSSKKRKMTQAEQSERFIAVAREIGVDESGAEFEKAIDRISKHV